MGKLIFLPLLAFFIFVEMSVCQVTNISSCSALQAISQNLGGSFQLTQSIDCTGFSLAPIGNSTLYFKGTFNGQNYSILNLTINNLPGSSNVGVFGFASRATITNFTLVNPNLTGTNSSNVGFVFGWANACTISFIRVLASNSSRPNILLAQNSAGSIGGKMVGGNIINCTVQNTVVNITGKNFFSCLNFR